MELSGIASLGLSQLIESTSKLYNTLVDHAHGLNPNIPNELRDEVALWMNLLETISQLQKKEGYLEGKFQEGQNLCNKYATSLAGINRQLELSHTSMDPWSSFLTVQEMYLIQQSLQEQRSRLERWLTEANAIPIPSAENVVHETVLDPQPLDLKIGSILRNAPVFQPRGYYEETATDTRDGLERPTTGTLNKAVVEEQWHDATSAPQPQYEHEKKSKDLEAIISDDHQGLLFTVPDTSMNHGVVETVPTGYEQLNQNEQTRDKPLDQQTPVGSQSTEQGSHVPGNGKSGRLSEKSLQDGVSVLEPQLQSPDQQADSDIPQKGFSEVARSTNFRDSDIDIKSVIEDFSQQSSYSQTMEKLRILGAGVEAMGIHIHTLNDPGIPADEARQTREFLTTSFQQTKEDFWALVQYVHAESQLDDRASEMKHSNDDEDLVIIERNPKRGCNEQVEAATVATQSTETTPILELEKGGKHGETFAIEVSSNEVPWRMPQRIIGMVHNGTQTQNGFKQDELKKSTTEREAQTKAISLEVQQKLDEATDAVVGPEKTYKNSIHVASSENEVGTRKLDSNEHNMMEQLSGSPVAQVEKDVSRTPELTISSIGVVAVAPTQIELSEVGGHALGLEGSLSQEEPVDAENNTQDPAVATTFEVCQTSHSTPTPFYPSPSSESSSAAPKKTSYIGSDNVSRAIIERDTRKVTEVFAQIVGGSFFKTDLELGVLEVDGDDWSARFCEDHRFLNGILMAVTLPKHLFLFNTRHFPVDQDNWTRGALVRTISMVTESPRYLHAYPLRHGRSLLQEGKNLLLHWNLENCRESHVSARFKELVRIGGELQTRITNFSYKQMVVCITIPWSVCNDDYCEEQRQALEFLDNMGIMGALPVNERIGSRVRETFWCPSRLKLGGSEQSIHAFIQETIFTGSPDLLPELASTPTRFVIVTVRKGQVDDWVDAVQHSLGMKIKALRYSVPTEEALSISHLSNLYRGGDKEKLEA